MTTSDAAAIQPGDVILVQVRTGPLLARLSGWAIRVGAVLTGQPATWNHVIVAHHIDAAGTFWGVEGRPGGVGWVDLAHWLGDAVTLANTDQPKTEQQRSLICDAALAALGRPYDWGGIVVDAMRAIQPVWRIRSSPWGTSGDTIPGQLVCSSLADWAYDRAQLPNPRTDRWCTPADWAAWITSKGWER